MTTNIDRACEWEERDREIALAVQKRRAGLAGKTTADSAHSCVDCAETIPDSRRAAVPGCKFCVECQGHREKAFYER